MKKILLALAIISMSFIAPISVFAQTQSAEDSQIEESLREKGLDEAPEVIEVPESEMRGQAPSSGFVDDEGNPLSDAEYQAYLDDQKGVFQKYPWLWAVLAIPVLGVIAGVVTLIVVLTKKK